MEYTNPNPRLKRFKRIALWAAFACVLAFGLIVNYAGMSSGTGKTAVAAAGGETAALDTTVLNVLSPDARELRALFNADAEAVRLVTLLAPS